MKYTACRILTENGHFSSCILLIYELYFCLRDKIAQAKKLEIAVRQAYCAGHTGNFDGEVRAYDPGDVQPGWQRVFCNGHMPRSKVPQF